MTDHEFLTLLTTGRLPPDAFDHTAHVRLGYLCLRDGDFSGALLKVRELIKRFAQSIGKGALYDEDITVRFLELIALHLRERGDGGGWDAFRERNPELLRRDALPRTSKTA